MFPFLEIWWSSAYMTGIGIICFILVFCGALYRYTKRAWVQFNIFFQRLPQYILIVYVCSTYIYYFVREFIWFPLSREQLLLYFSPYGYTFHLVWAIIGIVISMGLFYQHIETPTGKAKWTDSLFTATSLWLIPLGIGLLLWDQFIGLATEWSFYISAMHAESLVAVYDKVLPLWLLLSVIGLVWYGFSILLRNRNTRPWWWYLAFALLALALWGLIAFQQYPRHLVMALGDIRIDIKHYVLLIVSLLLARKYFRTRTSIDTSWN